MPKATDTFNDSFLPRMGISKILSDTRKIFGDTPPTSFPKTRAMSVF